jgi:hypothetical protein
VICSKKYPKGYTSFLVPWKASSKSYFFAALNNNSSTQDWQNTQRAKNGMFGMACS